mgnify:CR=1 FL=1
MQNDFDITKVLMSSANNESQSIHITSEVLDPATANFGEDQEIVFNIRKAGVINKSSAVHLTVQGSIPEERLTIGGGVFSLIKRAELRTSKGVVICQSDNINNLASLRNKFTEMSVREKRGVILNGSYECFETILESQANSAANEQNCLRLKGDYSGGGGDLPIEYRLGTNEIEYQITLEQLFPESVYFQLPVFLLDSNLQLVLTCAKQEDRGTTSDGDVRNIPGGTGIPPADPNDPPQTPPRINIIKAQYVSDHLFFDSKTMAQLRAKSETSGIPIPYNDFYVVDLALQSPNTAIATDQHSQKEFRKFIGLSNLDLKYLLFQQQVQPKDDDSIQRNMLMGGQSSRGSWYGEVEEGGVHLNIIKNNQQYYPIDIEKDSRFYTELELVHKKPMCIPRTTYSASGQVVDEILQTDSLIDANAPPTDPANANMKNKKLNLPSSNNLISTSNYFGVSQQNNLTAVNNYLGINFATVPGPVINSGAKVGFSPLEIKYTRQFTENNDDNLVLKVFACIGRVMVIKGGEVAVSYS